MSDDDATLVAILTPCQDLVGAGYALDLSKMVGRVARSRPDIELAQFQVRGSIIPQQRETLAQSALQIAATHALWIDADMRFPKDALERMLAHEKPIVAANYTRRRPPYLPTAEDRDKGYLFTEPGNVGLAEVTSCGMGLMLVEMSVFEQLPEPWFSLGFNMQDKTFVGEDFYFCRKAREAGFPVLIDQALSLEVKHAGEMEVRSEHAVNTREMMFARQLESADGP